GQWGLAFRYMFEPLDTEFGAYFMNYHSRMPIFSGAGPDAATQATINTFASGIYDLSPALGTAAGAALTAANGQYFIEYPEDIRLYGLSFSTTLPTGTAWQGEISYRPNAPVQLSTTDVLYAGLRNLQLNGVAVYDGASLLAAAPGQELNGYNRKEVTQLQTTFTHFVDQVMGASRMTLVGEIGWTHVGGLESSSEARYGRDPIFGPGAGAMCTALNVGTVGDGSQATVSKFCENDGFTTADSWGYRARVMWEYPNALLGVNL